MRHAIPLFAISYKWPTKMHFDCYDIVVNQPDLLQSNDLIDWVVLNLRFYGDLRRASKGTLRNTGTPNSTREVVTYSHYHVERTVA